MSLELSAKAWEVVPLVLAGVAFAIWQLRDVNRALERSRAERKEREAREAREARQAPERPDGSPADAPTVAPPQEPTS